jgi:hypothetical protein
VICLGPSTRRQVAGTLLSQGSCRGRQTDGGESSALLLKGAIAVVVGLSLLGLGPHRHPGPRRVLHPGLEE